MPRPRSPKTALLHALDESICPIYLLDDQGQILFANAACGSWLGCEPDSIAGLVCRPSALPLSDDIQNRIRGLLPHPACPETPSSQVAVFATTSTGAIDQRIAKKFSLHQPENRPALQIFVVDVEAPNEERAVVSPGLDLTIRDLIAQLASEHRRMHDLTGLVGVHPNTRRLRSQLEAAGEVLCNVNLIGSVGTNLEHYARIVFHLRHPEARTLPIFLDGRLADQEQIQESVGNVLRRGNDRLESTTLLMVHSELLSSAAQMELSGFLNLPSSRLRVIATSAASLRSLAQSGTFDVDLALRLSGIEVEVPRLTDRRNDIPVIAAHLLELARSQKPGMHSGFSAAALQLLLEFNWPGDLEQLKSVVAQAALRETSEPIGPEHLPEVVHYGVQAQRIGRPTQTKIDLDQFLAGIEHTLLERALGQSKGNKAQAAKLLGITRSRLLRRCEQLGLSTADEPIDFRATDSEDLRNPESEKENP